MQDLFLFYNATSGGNKGKEYANLSSNKIELKDVVTKDDQVNVHLYDIKQEGQAENQKPGFVLLRSLLEERSARTMDFTGYYTYVDSKKENPIFTLTIPAMAAGAASGAVTGEGRDKIGFFYLNGTRKKEGEVEFVKFTKKYVGLHSVFYETSLRWQADGNAEMKGIWYSVECADVASFTDKGASDGVARCFEFTTKAAHGFYKGESIRIRNMTDADGSHEALTNKYSIQSVTETTVIVEGVGEQLKLRSDSRLEVEIVTGDIVLESKGSWKCQKCSQWSPSSNVFSCANCEAARSSMLAEDLAQVKQRVADQADTSKPQTLAEDAEQEMERIIKEREDASRKAAQKLQDPLRVVVAGGDGTVMWAISSIESHRIDHTQIAIGVVPFGTGNDFSRALGWGGAAPAKLVGVDNVDMKRHVGCWLKAELKPYDVWQVEVKTQARGSTSSGGDFKFVHDAKKKSATPEDKGRHNINPDGDALKMGKLFINYFSFGFDPRVALGMEKKRTKSRTGNLIRYAWEGVKKQTCRAPPKVTEFLRSVTIVGGQDQREVLFGDDAEEPKFNGSPSEVMVLNCLTFAGGRDLWGWSKTKKATTSDSAPLKDAAQDFGDGKVELLTYSRMGFGMDVALPCCRGRGARMFQGPAQKEQALTFEFKDYKKPRNEGRVYMEIDGEAFVCCHPDSVKIQLYKQIKVLYNGDDPWPTPSC
mmetsp:Transcript_10389/g.22469  ORF Transcript_10389/g.22469 Transcript_10389/m.22469 type:complete len:704 (+) Transcript_10389:69-2180(+)